MSCLVLLIEGFGDWSRQNRSIQNQLMLHGVWLPAKLASQSMANGSAVMAEEGMRVHGAWMGSGG